MRALLIAVAALLAAHGLAAAQTAPAPKPAAPATPAAPKRTVDLTRMGSSLDEGGLDTRFQFGLACVTDPSLRWRSASTRFSDPGFKRVFRDAMAEAGIKTASGGGGDLFNGPAGGGELQVGAMIRSLRLETCTRSNRRDAETEGSAHMEVEWQVYSAEEGKVPPKGW